MLMWKSGPSSCGGSTPYCRWVHRHAEPRIGLAARPPRACAHAPSCTAAAAAVQQRRAHDASDFSSATFVPSCRRAVVPSFRRAVVRSCLRALVRLQSPGIPSSGCSWRCTCTSSRRSKPSLRRAPRCPTSTGRRPRCSGPSSPSSSSSTAATATLASTRFTGPARASAGCSASGRTSSARTLTRRHALVKWNMLRLMLGGMEIQLASLGGTDSWWCSKGLSDD